jgi:hypothetical protein
MLGGSYIDRTPHPVPPGPPVPVNDMKFQIRCHTVPVGSHLTVTGVSYPRDGLGLGPHPMVQIRATLVTDSTHEAEHTVHDVTINDLLQEDSTSVRYTDR